MSKKLIERLRELAETNHFCLGSYQKRCAEAACRIEELKKERDEMRLALRVIYTWSAVEREAMNHQHVMSLVERTLRMKRPK